MKEYRLKQWNLY